MSNLQVTCINKQPRDNTHEGITHLGGTGWKWTRAQVIQAIESKQHSYFTQAGTKVAYVGVVEGANGKYLRTYADGVWNDNLLALPECV